MANAFELPGDWYKGNVHCHTTESDGRVSPSERIRGYRERGYDFLAISDHDLVTVVMDADAGLTMITSGEYNPANPREVQGVDLLALGVPLGFAVPSDMLLQDAINAVRAEGGLGFIAHPYWTGVTVKDIAGLKGLAGIEIFNLFCSNANSKGMATALWDNLLDVGWRGWGLSVDDAHFDTHDTYGGWIMVKAKANNADELLGAIGRGEFYASTGPTIHKVERTDDGFHVECSEADSIAFIADRSAGGKVRSEDGSPIRCAEYKLYGFERYIRIEVTSKEFGIAWTNPFFLEDSTVEELAAEAHESLELPE